MTGWSIPTSSGGCWAIQGLSGILGEMNSSIKDMLGKINIISENVSNENAEMEEINQTIGELHSFADEIGEMVSTLYK